MRRHIHRSGPTFWVMADVIILERISLAEGLLLCLTSLFLDTDNSLEAGSVNSG